jgi:outer membrane autotransporter protein
MNLIIFKKIVSRLVTKGCFGLVIISASTLANAENFLTVLELNETNTSFETLFSSESYLGDAAYDSEDFDDAISFLDSQTSSLVATPDNTNQYNYARVSFDIEAVTGSYTFGQSSSPSDTFLFLYQDSVDPLALSTNFLSANDDSGEDRGWNSGATIPPGVTISTCGGDGGVDSRCPVLTADLVAGESYTLLLSHYESEDFEVFEFPLGVFIYGPELVLFSTSGTSVFDSSLAQTNSPAYAAAMVIDANAEILALFDGFTGDEEISEAAESLLPGITGGVAQVTNIATNAVTGVVAARQDLTRGLSSGDGFMTDRHIWFKPFGGWTKQDERQGVTGYDIDSYGFAAGFDGYVSSSWNVGAALAYINSDVESEMTAGKHTVDMDSYQAKVYATAMLDDMTAVNLQLGGGVSDYDSKRDMRTLNEIADADYDGWNMQFSAELERSYQVSDKTVVTPYVHADYSYVNVEDYNETGAGLLNLNVDDDSADSLIIGAGAKGNHAVSDSLLLMANAGIGYDVMTDRSSLTSSFAGGGAQFTTEGMEPDEWVYNAGVGVKYSLENGTEITANYTVDARQNYTDQSLSANFRFMF